MTAETAPAPIDTDPRAGYTIAISMLGLSALLIAGVLGDTFHETRTGADSALLYLGGIGLILGLIFGAATWVRMGIAEGQRQLAIGQADLATEMAAVREEFGRLAAARTIDLHEARKALQEMVTEVQDRTLLGQNTIAKLYADQLEASAHQSTKAAVGELTARMEELGKAVTHLKEQHLKEVEEAYELGRLTGPGDATI